MRSALAFPVVALINGNPGFLPSVLSGAEHVSRCFSRHLIGANGERRAPRAREAEAPIIADAAALATSSSVWPRWNVPALCAG